MKKTKEELLKENARLERDITSLKDDDNRTRETLSELLGSYEIINDIYSPRNSRKTIVRDWLGIAFLIGKLKADADYSATVEAREKLKREVSVLKEKIYKLENPDDPTIRHNSLS